MKKTIALEEAAQFFFALFMISRLPIPINAWTILYFFLPDCFAIGYVINKTTGAVLYNIAHHKLVALALVFGGFYFKQDYVLLAGLLCYAHSSFDRMIGYGLKYPDSPNHTHLGWVGKERHKENP